MPRTRDEQCVVLQMASEIHRDERADDLSDEGLARQKPASQEDVGRDEHASRVAEGKTLGKSAPASPAPGSGRECGGATLGVSIALACRTFGVREACYRYSPLLSNETEEIASAGNTTDIWH